MARSTVLVVKDIQEMVCSVLVRQDDMSLTMYIFDSNIGYLLYWYFLQMKTNAKMEHTTVTRMLNVTTPSVLSTVPVSKDIQEMECNVLVRHHVIIIFIVSTFFKLGLCVFSSQNNWSSQLWNWYSFLGQVAEPFM